MIAPEAGAGSPRIVQVWAGIACLVYGATSMILLF